MTERISSEHTMSQESLDIFCLALSEILTQESYDKLMLLSPERRLGIIETIKYSLEESISTNYDLFENQPTVKKAELRSLKTLKPRERKVFFD